MTLHRTRPADAWSSYGTMRDAAGHILYVLASASIDEAVALACKDVRGHTATPHLTREGALALIAALQRFLATPLAEEDRP